MPAVVIGLGFVGLTLALALADKGVTVFGVESNNGSYKTISAGKPTINEKGIELFLRRNLGRTFKVFEKLEDVPGSEVDTYVICVGTPLQSGSPYIGYLKSAAESVGKHMKGNEMVIVRSTVPIGTTRKIVLPILQDELKKRGREAPVNIAFAPERTAEGVALQELYELPQIVGGINEESVSRSMNLFRRLTPTVIMVSSIETAEMIKLIDNSYRDVRFAYANEIALMCEKLGIDANECISKSNVHYPRNSIPFPSPGVGGPCLSKDPYILAQEELVDYLPNKRSLIIAGRRLNEAIPDLLAEKIKNKILSHNKSAKDLKVFVMGFAFKGHPETNDIRDSPTIPLVNIFKKNFTVHGHDPAVSKDVIEAAGATPTDIESGFKNAASVIIMNNHLLYRNLDITSLIEKAARPFIFVDCWRLYDKKIFENIDGVTYTGVGIV